MFSSHCPDLVVLDLGLPDLDGSEFIAFARRISQAPIVVLSARTTDADKVTALDMGANDYITKPFSAAEFLARIRSALRNRRYDDQDGIVGDTFDVSDLHIDFSRRQITLAGSEIRLTQTEYNIVSVLAHHAGQVMTYSAIIRAVWGSTDEGSIKKLQVNLANIRKKLGERPGDRRYISNELGVGYRMMSDE
jgi:two-component system KDP operon response regulator KdpE